MPTQKKRNPDDHSGHRQRMKTALLKEGAGKMEELDLLEMLLYYVLPRIDTRKIANKLLEKFGSLEGILDAPQGEIAQINGLKDNAEVLFALIRELLIRFGRAKSEASLLEAERMKKFLVDLYQGITVETVYALYFAHDGSFCGKQIIFRGGISSAKFSLRLITEGVIRAGGNSVVLAHNHPSDILIPSEEDILSTRRMAANLAANDITLIEHYIVGKENAVGFFDTNNG